MCAALYILVDRGESLCDGIVAVKDITKYHERDYIISMLITSARCHVRMMCCPELGDCVDSQVSLNRWYILQALI